VRPPFRVSAWTEDGLVMGLRREGDAGDAPLEGVQFHPESFMTPEGPRLLANFIAAARDPGPMPESPLPATSVGL